MSRVYQFAACQLNSHMRLTLSTGLINLLWLLPIAILVALQYIDDIVGMIIAYIPLIILVNLYKAGEKESQSV